MIEKITIIGAGTMGRGLANLFTQNNVSVNIIDSSERALEQLRLVFPSQTAQQTISFSQKMDTACDSDLVIEAVPEILDIKQSVFRKIEHHCSPKALIATNTSGLSISKIASVLDYPERALGTHFFMPADIMPLVEVVKGNKTTHETADRVIRFLTRIGKKPVLIERDVPGFVANRIQHALAREAIALLEAGVASAEDIDTVVRYSIGPRLAVSGPLEQRDLNGLDVHYAIACYLYPELENRTTPSDLLAEKVKKGMLGLKSGTGFYQWPEKTSEIRQQKNNQLLRLLNWINQEEQGGKNV
ncbi:3-hydroxyacyl-CoA dehydrogenase NAD-binding domain-containing protein [Sporolactobacillus spathodeae]|uniref:3-hydroxybutyryl-CoA dehydrogenase n=1 Tax=Sporolactobacillus spathodeae TaxID=1465502 RepID=A0ABS2QAU3_9BACL|nr:3-hydroxyacyl-CoA dehydrogenase NAD-binding domain-containing protein [Sporolactobacillus spathodeae]MBM7658924.1 3-hydroxybutyryl-CoA dehydrogenase [Sporolactobacillus spathodeae]